MSVHIPLARLAPELAAELGADERAHLQGCPRCRIEARLLAEVFDVDLEELPEFEEISQTLDAVRSVASASMVAGTLADTPVLDTARQRIDEALPGDSDRYDVLDTLGQGGMGTVLRVRDKVLGRRVAMKVASPRFQENAMLLGRFVDEAQVGAQLQHPGIVPVHEMGKLEDGRVFFTMKEIEGHTLSDAVLDVHLASRPGVWATGSLGWSFRRLIEAFRRVCETMAYAHSKGVCHRDLKPANIMVGAWGEVLVVDWGLAKVSGAVGDERSGEEPVPGTASDEQSLVSTFRKGEDDLDTRVGTVTGTPTYMAPEQARGDLDAIGPETDVYSLGVLLYVILSGRSPYHGQKGATIDKLLAGPPPPPEALAGPIPDELVAICGRAMEREPADRYAHAGELSEAVADWLEDAGRRERALAELELAGPLAPRSGLSRDRASALRQRAARLLEQVASHDPVEAKLEGWQLEDEARELEELAVRQDLQFTQQVQSALTHDPTLPEAHSLLADHYRSLHEAAESAGDRAAAQRCEVLLRSHDAGEHGAYLAGKGRLSLVTDPPGASVEIRPFVESERRLLPGPSEPLGQAPLHEVELPMGSYLLQVEAPGRQTLELPLRIERAQHMDWVRPGASQSSPLVLPAPGELAEGDCLVPAGWFLGGGDARTPSSLPARRVWVDSFVVKAKPVTHRDYLHFLNDLAGGGRLEDALEHAPRERPTRPGDRGDLLLAYDDSSGFALREDAEGDRWELDWPAWMVSWHGARAYAAWLAERDGLPWRLPWELEWEKAARGVDGRAWPWGDFGDPTWACVHGSRPGRPMPSSVEDWPSDRSPWAVYGTAGNVCDWVLDVFTEEGTALASGGLFEPPDLQLDQPNLSRCVKGGSWSNSILHGRGAFRDGRHADDRRWVIGFRVARSY